jgi:hypothetical protein
VAKSLLKTVDSLQSSKVKIGEWQNIDVVTDIGNNNSQIGMIKASTSTFKRLASLSK